MQVGQVVRIKAKWCGKHEDAADLYVVMTPDEPGKPRVDIAALEDMHLPFWPMSVVTLDMLETTPYVLDMQR